MRRAQSERNSLRKTPQATVGFVGEAACVVVSGSVADDIAPLLQSRFDCSEIRRFDCERSLLQF